MAVHARHDWHARTPNRLRISGRSVAGIPAGKCGQGREHGRAQPGCLQEAGAGQRWEIAERRSGRSRGELAQPGVPTWYRRNPVAPTPVAVSLTEAGAAARAARGEVSKVTTASAGQGTNRQFPSATGAIVFFSTM